MSCARGRRKSPRSAYIYILEKKVEPAHSDAILCRPQQVHKLQPYEGTFVGPMPLRCWPIKSM